MNTKEILNKLVDRTHLTSKEAGFLLEEIINGQLNPSQVAAFLIGLRTKGETVEEITGLIQTMRKHMLTIKAPKGTIDIVGTGGDGSGSFNISTAASFVVAGAGVPVAKHGNRAASSKCGSADVLEALGVNIQLTPEQAEKVLKRVGMVFLFAPLYHPAMKHIAPIRKELGVRTVFNFLGPFLNPANVKRALIGVPNKVIAKKLAQVAAKIGYDNTMLVSSSDGMDEISTLAKSHAFIVQKKNVQAKTIRPIAKKSREAGSGSARKATKNDVLGGDVLSNVAIIQTILQGEKGPKRDIVVLNSAYALVVAGKAKDVREGLRMAERSIDGGSAKQILENLRKETKQYA